MIELHAGTPFYIDDPAAPCLAVGFADQRDSSRFVGFERAYRIEPDDGLYLDRCVSVEFGFDEPLRGIYADVIDTVRLQPDRLTLVLKGELHGTVVIHFAAAGLDYDRLAMTLGVLFDDTGQLLIGADDDR